MVAPIKWAMECYLDLPSAKLILYSGKPFPLSLPFTASLVVAVDTFLAIFTTEGLYARQYIVRGLVIDWT